MAFDPEKADQEIKARSKKIAFNTAEFTIELLVEKIKLGDLYIPDYQRKDVWDSKRKFKFIESVLMGLPIPFLFFWENEETGKLEIVDGVQRLYTLQQYISPEKDEKPLKLENLEEMPELNGSIFSELLESRQRKFKNKTIRANILSEHADAKARFEMFERINTGSKLASQPEIRRGASPGPFMDMIKELAESEKFKKLAPLSQKKIDRRDNEDLVTRFFAYGDGIENYKNSPKNFVAAYVSKMNEEFKKNSALESQYKKRFTQVLSFAEQYFPFGFAKSLNETPHARFEALSVGAYWALKENSALTPPDGTRRYFTPAKRGVSKTAFDEVVASDSANNRSKLEGRINFVKDYLLS